MQNQIETSIRQLNQIAIAQPIENVITSEEIVKTIKNTANFKAPGADQIQNILLKQLAGKAICQINVYKPNTFQQHGNMQS